jgi:hypothetical protein
MWDELGMPWILISMAHLVVASIHLHDLFTKSRRSNKALWSLFLIAVPFFSAVAYRNTMKRRKRGVV